MAKAKAEAVAVATLDRQEAEAMAKAEDSVLQPLSRSWDSATLQALAKAAPLPLQMAVAVASARPWDWEPPAADAWAKAAPKLWLAEPPPWELRAGVLGGGGGGRRRGCNGQPHAGCGWGRLWFQRAAFRQWCRWLHRARGAESVQRGIASERATVTPTPGMAIVKVHHEGGQPACSSHGLGNSS